MPSYPENHGGGNRDNGGTPRFFAALTSGKLWHWAFAPEYEWTVPVTASDLYGPAATASTDVTIPASGFVSGRVTLTFSHADLSADVEVTADAAVGDANTDLATALEAAVATARAGDLAGYVTDEVALSNVVTIEHVAGLGIAVSWRSAQQTTVQLAGTIYDAIYRVTLTGGGLGAPVPISTARTSGTPAAITDLIVQRETDAEALIGTTLAGVLVSADDDGADLNTFIFEPDIDDVTITATIVLDTEAMSQTVADVTPAGPTITAERTVTVDLGALSAAKGTFPGYVLREEVNVNVTEAFGAGRTLTVGDAGDPDGLIGSTPIDLDTVARSLATTSDAEYRHQAEPAMTPTATFALGEGTVTTGRVVVGIVHSPLPCEAV